MDTDWTFSSCSWLWEEDSEFKNEYVGSHWTKEEDKTFENALALYNNDADRWDKIASAVPGKTIEDLKLHYEALSLDIFAIESGEVLLPHYQSNYSDHKKKKKTLRGVNRGIPWTEEEHRRFLDGLEKYGRGDWKSIARFSVQTKSNSQVASHAQKYFKRLNSTSKDGKRHSINDDHSRTTSALHKPMTSTMPGNDDDGSKNAGKQLLNRTPFGDMSVPLFSRQTISEPGTSATRVAEYNMFSPQFSSQKIMSPDSSAASLPSCSMSVSLFADLQMHEPDLVGMAPYYPLFSLMQDNGVPPPPASFDFPSISEIQPLMQDNEVPVLCSFGIPIIPESQSLIQDSGVPNSGLFGFPSINEIQPVVQDSGAYSGSFDIPRVSEIQPLIHDCGAPPRGLLDIPSTSDIQQPLVQQSEVPGSSLSGIPSSSIETLDLDVFVLPHFLDID